MRDVLIIDYDPELREQVSHVLNGGVYALTFASDGVEALKLVKQKRFDLILVDLLMPGALNGIQILQGMQRHAPASPLVVMSERNGHQELETAMRYGAREVLLKPVHLELMKAVADRLTGGLVRPREGTVEPQLEAVKGRIDLAASDVTELESPAGAAADEAGEARSQEPAAAVHCRAKLFTGLSDTTLEALMSRSRKVTLEAGQEIAFDACQTMVVVNQGVARCWYKGLLISVLEPGDYIGETALFSRAGERLPLILDGNSGLEVCLLSRKLLRGFYQEQGAHHLLHFAARVVQNLSDRLLHLYDELNHARRDGEPLSGVDEFHPLMEELSEESDEWIC